MIIKKLFLVVALMLIGCSPLITYHDQLVKNNLNSFLITGKPYKHRVITASQKQSQDSSFLVIIVGGDGAAVTSLGRVSKDPTPVKAPLLSAIPSLSQQTIFLGRPCYFYTLDALCAPHLWTVDRYSRPVVDSMVHAVRAMNQNHLKVVLVGRSGGGTIAFAMAKEMPEVVGLITLAGNMNVNEWVKEHGYTPMPSAEDPSQQHPLRCNIKQIHIAGGKDKNIYPHWVKEFVDKQSQSHCRNDANNVEYILLKEATHKTGWGQWYSLIDWNRLKVKSELL